VFFRYDQAEGEPRYGGLPWDPFKAIVGPRPIGWISTISPDGVVNLAPYSYYNAVGDRPNQVYFASSGSPSRTR
jgi:flavin reductase (DIM6/NTAB) family NADH-FMN oxidoreductase RutF